MDQNQEPGRDKLEGGELHVKHGKAWRWFDNFWYHYKWQIIIVAIVLIAVLVCMLSMCHRKDPDFYFYYVGQGEFSGDEQRAIISSLSKASGDDGHDADVSVTFLFLMTNDQIKRFGEEHKDDGLTVNGGLIGQNRELLSNEIMTGTRSLCSLIPRCLPKPRQARTPFFRSVHTRPRARPTRRSPASTGSISATPFSPTIRRSPPSPRERSSPSETGFRRSRCSNARRRSRTARGTKRCSKSG
ncbi:MAG: hypothetical protein IKX66_06165 [Clostridia bacterium]|nr:hypothetical protein [Clostridia bacterium]